MQARSVTLEKMSLPLPVPAASSIHFSLLKRKEAEKSVLSMIQALAPPVPHTRASPRGSTPSRESTPREPTPTSGASSRELFVSNLPFSMTEDELLELFLVFSPVEISLVQARGIHFFSFFLFHIPTIIKC